MAYVIKLTEHNGRYPPGWYTAPADSGHSYVKELQNARTFTTVAAAQRECCGNEVVRDVADEVRSP